MPLNIRRAGILVHPTSLPGPFGIGDLGPACDDFLAWVRDAGLAYWQILPLGPTGFGDSPYQCFSAFAGNTLLISPERLMEQGLLTADDLAQYPHLSGNVDYGQVFTQKNLLLRAAYENFLASNRNDLRERYNAWCDDAHVANWLNDYALFRALKKENDERCWTDWPAEVKQRSAPALAEATRRLADEIGFQKFSQFLFFIQWQAVRDLASSYDIEIIGDAPIYVSFDSADTWANQSEFQLDGDGNPTVVAGVPPDYFSETGQLWGNPLYNWDEMEKNGFSWWVDRLRAIFDQVDIVRLDHFRGFMGYYAVPFGHPTAEHGTWVKGPGERFFVAMEDALGDLPIIAEDLGEITEDVTRARKVFGFPGMVILQFAWPPANTNPLIADPNNNFLPHRHEHNSVVYTGTHDNDTTVGWWNNSSSPEERSTMQVYMSVDGRQPHWDLIRTGMRSVANTFIVPAQDLLGLGTDCRMNLPGRATGNWTWRLQPGQLSAELAEQMRNFVLLYERCQNPPPEAVPAPPKTLDY